MMDKGIKHLTNEIFPQVAWAKENKAALFNLEHRYYGDSNPVPMEKTKDYTWLSSRFKYNNERYKYFLKYQEKL
jgi:hypothetical protein